MKAIRLLRFCVLPAVLAAAWPCHASEAGRPVVEDLAQLLEQARAQGSARGILGGESARKLRSQGIDQPILVDVTAVARLRQKDCRRLRVALSQKQVLMPGSKAPQDRNTQFEMNYCPGGNPPKDERSAEAAAP